MPVRDGNRMTGFDLSQAQDLRDEVHRLADEGRPVRVPDPGTEHGRALVRTLGAEIETQDAICTSDDRCTAAADGHHDDCPVEHKLRDEIGF